jgi:hypothetical protein
MTLDDTITKLRGWNYSVEPAQPSTDEESALTYLVSGFGLSVYVDKDDTEFWDSLADDNAQAERAQQDQDASAV